jgi:hypothetical protein
VKGCSIPATFFIECSNGAVFLLLILSLTYFNTMKNFIVPILFCLLSAAVQAQEKLPSVTVKWAPTGLVYGNVSLQGEYNFGRNSLTAKLGIPMSTHRHYDYDDKEARFSMKAVSFMAGYRTYLSKKHMRGFYFEPYFKYVHHTSEGAGNGFLSGEPVRMNFTNDYNGIGFGAQLGVQFLVWKKLVIDLFFLGPEINFSRNSFNAVEVSSTIPWTLVQASEAESDIRKFIDQFPFVRNKTDIMVDRHNKSVRADFRGAIPGIRTGISIGVAF